MDEPLYPRNSVQVLRNEAWIWFQFVEIQVGPFAIFDKEVNDVWFMKKRSNRVGCVWGAEGI